MARQLTSFEAGLIRWMLEHGHEEARSYLSQLEQASVTDYRCPCGCASINLVIEGFSEQAGGMHVLAEFVFGNETDLSGIFVYEKGGLLAGLEVFGWAGEALKTLPMANTLMPFEALG